jgi:CRP-like cAMP-binding protein
VEYIDTLAGSPLFTGLNRSSLVGIRSVLTPESWPKGCQIVSSPADRFRIVVNGRVKISHTNGGDGRELILWLLGPGDGFHVTTLLDGHPDTAIAWALDETVTLSASVSQFREWMERLPPLRQAVLCYAARQMRSLSDLAADVALHDTMTRLARLLLHHLDRTSGVDPERHNLIQGLSQEELASLIGSVRVVVSRLLAQLKREAAIGLQNGELRIADLKRLLKRAQLHHDRAYSKRRRLISSRA